MRWRYIPLPQRLRVRWIPVSVQAVVISPASLVRTREQGTPVGNPQLLPASLVRTRAQGTPTVHPQILVASLTRTREQGSPTVSAGAVFITPASLERQRNELRRILIRDAGGISGTFTLNFKGQITTTIAFNASAATVKSALEGLSNIDPGDVEVRDLGVGGDETLDQEVEFKGQWAYQDIPTGDFIFDTTPSDSSSSIGNRQNGGTGRGQGFPAVNPQLLLASLIRSRAQGTPTVSPQLKPASLTRTRAQGSPVVSIIKIITPASITHTRAQGTPRVNPQILLASLIRTRALGNPNISIPAAAGQHMKPYHVQRTER